ncbi:hypothetical protein PF005_g24783 [Phytophthora fragariae]|nr:hypothetical protein PF003_g25566 [Phytophthora fragariae]KAE8977793.1 hypothetical protein PF011_g23508 [Phytophthora fragariae]KAE9075962.1 hypothetical protein PF010_g24094 [Phytophthora fragariae]KAE9176765.1 hypothetical protein PF005_g24783 [Phytophthora fragariae]KAE9184375.1 hypothetical protein PF004_g23683 [Phytophthora fragariae]
MELAVSLLLLSCALHGVDAWSMQTVTSYQARVETYAPVWDADQQVFVSGVPDALFQREPGIGGFCPEYWVVE